MSWLHFNDIGQPTGISSTYVEGGQELTQEQHLALLADPGLLMGYSSLTSLSYAPSNIVAELLVIESEFPDNYIASVRIEDNLFVSKWNSKAISRKAKVFVFDTDKNYLDSFYIGENFPVPATEYLLATWENSPPVIFLRKKSNG